MLSDVLTSAISPALALLPPKMDTDAARVILLAIGLQESRFEHRAQIGGPARGFWQFEKGGVGGALFHLKTAQLADAVCESRGLPPAVTSVYLALQTDDVLAAAFARLLLWTDAQPLPALDDPDGAWALYLRTWRPGKPHPETWPDLYARARAAV